MNLKYAKNILFAIALIFIQSATFAQNELENSRIFTSGNCLYPYEGKTLFTPRDYIEFIKIYNSPTRKQAVARFRKLLNSAKTDAAKAWAYYGLFQLGEIKADEIPAIQCPTLSNNFYNEKNNLSAINFAKSPVAPENAILDNIDFNRLNAPQDLDAYALWALIETNFFAEGSISEGGITPLELWACNKIANGTNALQDAYNIWENAKSIAGKLYSIKILLRLGKESQAREKFESLPKDSTIYAQSGCSAYSEKIEEIDFDKFSKKNDSSFNSHYAEKYQIMLPCDGFQKVIPYDTLPVKTQNCDYDELKLGYLPMRYRDMETDSISMEGIEQIVYLAMFSKNNASKYLKLLNFLPESCGETFAIDIYYPLLLKKRNGKWTYEKKLRWFDAEARFLTSFMKHLAETSFDRLSQKIRNARLKEFFSRNRYNSTNGATIACDSNEIYTSRNFAFAYLNKIKKPDGRTLYFSPEGINLCDIERYMKHPSEPISMIGIIAEANDNEGKKIIYPKTIPIFEDTSKTLLEAIAKLYEKRLNELTSDERDFLKKFFEEKNIISASEYVRDLYK